MESYILAGVHGRKVMSLVMCLHTAGHGGKGAWPSAMLDYKQRRAELTFFIYGICLVQRYIFK